MAKQASDDQPGTQIRLRKENGEALGKQLAAYIDDLEGDQGVFFDNISKYWDLYDAKPIAERRTHPWDGASNVVVPVVGIMSDALTSQIYGKLHTPKQTWMMTSGDEAVEDIANSSTEFMNQESRSTFDIEGPTYDWTHETVVVGSSVLSVQWRNEYVWRQRPGNSRKPERILVSRGPRVEHVPRESIIWERDRTIQESSIVVRQQLLTYTDLVQQSHVYGWDRAVVESLYGKGGIEGPTGEVLQHKRRLEGVREGDTPTGQEPHDIREAWVLFDLAQLMSRSGNMGDPVLDTMEATERVPLVVQLHKNTGTVLRVVPHPYLFPEWPFLDVYFRKMAGRGSGKGVAKRLEHTQRSITTSVNQAHDAVTLSNSLRLKTSNPDLRHLRFNPFHPIFTDNMDDLQEIRVGAQITPDVNMVNMMWGFGERLSGVSDPGLGRETKTGGHPSPATNTMLQLQQSAALSAPTLKMIRRQLSKAGEMIFSMYQQFETAEGGQLAVKLGAEDAERLRQVFISPESFQFDLHAMSESQNPEASRNNAMVVMQMTTQYIATVTRFASLLDNPQTQNLKITRGVVEKGVQALTKAYIDFLRASEVDDAEKFALRLEEMNVRGPEQLEGLRDQLLSSMGGGAQPGQSGFGQGNGGEPPLGGVMQ